MEGWTWAHTIDRNATSAMAVCLGLSSAEAKQRQPMDQRSANKKTLLMVDDDPAILKLLSGLLADDLCVITADSGERALEQSGSFGGQIHLLLTDITMPNMNG